jgi:hypothetical protein
MTARLRPIRAGHEDRSRGVFGERDGVEVEGDDAVGAGELVYEFVVTAGYTLVVGQCDPTEGEFPQDGPWHLTRKLRYQIQAVIGCIM